MHCVLDMKGILNPLIISKNYIKLFKNIFIKRVLSVYEKESIHCHSM